MTKINIQTHRRILLSILSDIYRDGQIAPILGFKGGTSLYFFQDLPRFSTDLDFNLVGDVERFQPESIEKIMSRYLEIRDNEAKRNTWFWEGSYHETHQNIKIEISTRNYPDTYEIIPLYGLSVNCLEASCQFAHKLCAIMDRKILASRDLFDAHFMFKKQFHINENIIKVRTDLPLHDYFKRLLQYIPKHISKRGILDGLGHLLDDERKKWVKAHLLDELLFLLKAY